MSTLNVITVVPTAILAIGILLLILETLIPGGVFAILGVSFVLTGVTGAAIGTNDPYTIGVFVLVYGAIATYAYKNLNLFPVPEQTGTSDANSLVGETGMVTSTVTESSGKVKLPDSGFNPNYQDRTPHCPIEQGEKIRVTSPGGGNVIKVEPVNDTDTEQQSGA